MQDIHAVEQNYLSPETERREQDYLKTIDRVIAQGPFSADDDSLRNYRVPAWYEQGRFGIFIHWGVYAVPAFHDEWYPNKMNEPTEPVYQHHRDTYGPHDQFGYKDFIPLFKAEQFDPKAWAELFRQSGASFVVPVAEHHDGFAMYKSDFSRWTAAEMGPCRDVVGEIKQAVEEAGMVFGASSHRAEHWFFFGGARRFPSDVQDPAYAEFYGPAHVPPLDANVYDRDDGPDERYLNDWLVRTCELIDRYRPKLLWFDWWINQQNFAPYLRKLAAYYYNRAAEWGVEVAINYKYNAYPDGEAVLDVERGQLANIRPMLWQNDTSMYKTSWCYIDNQQYKTAQNLVADLMDIVAKNGALLLNIGPKADGTICERDQDILREIGAWLQVNGEAIHGVQPWRLAGEGPTEIPEGAFADTQRAPYTPADIRYTCGPKGLYAAVLAWPEDGVVTLGALAQGQETVQAVQLLGQGQVVGFAQKQDGLVIQTAGVKSNGFPVVFQICLNSQA